jgi:molybdenum cofactor guanylyltransferase
VRAETGVVQMPGWDAVVLAGGTSRRLRADSSLAPGTLPLGMDKTDLLLGGRTLLERVLDGCLGADRVAVVGPVRPVRQGSSGATSGPAAPGGAPSSTDRLLWCRESPPGAGPLAAVAAGVTALSASPAPVVVVLGGDMPFVGGAVPHLLAALARNPQIDASALARIDSGHHPLALAARRTALTSALAKSGDPTGRPLRHLLSTLKVAAIADAENWALDVDDGGDLRAALARVAASAGTSQMMSP